MADSQHRCVFVGNIPYDATEAQLVQICEEVGPVAKFRLVTDRETGKPKGYGFCEYKDEETALSAIRNLRDKDINGRKLRVDFAENDKKADRNLEQGFGGPGLATNNDPQKQVGGPAAGTDPSLLHHVGLQAAMAAAAVMAGVLGGAQASNVGQNGFPSQLTPGSDPLTLHLAKMPKGQLIEVLAELKAMATQNKEQVRNLLLAYPQFSKAVLQAHLMLKLVPSQMITGLHAQPAVQDSQLAQQPSAQTHHGLPPLALNKTHTGFMSQSQSQASAGHLTSMVHGQYTALPLPMHPRFQASQQLQHQVLQQSTLPGNLVAPAIPSSYRQQPQMGISSSMNTQVQHSLPQYPGPSSLGHNAPLVAPVQPSILPRPPLQDNGFQASSSRAPQHSSHDPMRVRKVDPHPNLGSGLHEKAGFTSDRDQIGHPPKMLKMEDGRGATFSPAGMNLTAAVLGSSQAVGISGSQILRAGASDSQKQDPELTPDVESALLQQVLNLTPEQLSSLPPEQQQQVIQLQQMLRQST